MTNESDSVLDDRRVVDATALFEARRGQNEAREVRSGGRRLATVLGGSVLTLFVVSQVLGAIGRTLNSGEVVPQKPADCVVEIDTRDGNPDNDTIWSIARAVSPGESPPDADTLRTQELILGLDENRSISSHPGRVGNNTPVALTDTQCRRAVESGLKINGWRE